jgi:hypothetical protein
MAQHGERVEQLLAEALAAYDQGGEAALETFVAAHPQDRTVLQRGIARCREMGMLGERTPVRDFPEQLGEFRLLQRLGGGGMGVVYEAEQQSLGRRVALKVIRPELLFFEGARERFRREIEAVARLSHPAVVPVLASGEQEGVPWYAMELLNGRTAQQVCTALAGRDPAELDGSVLRSLLDGAPAEATDPFAGAWWKVCLRLIHAVSLGVRHAHLRGIVHRDIKPSNVMITPHGTAVLLDFGVATVAGAHEFTRTGNTPGSPAFMSPEQLRGDAVDERTDVYSLAATLWQMLALAPAFRGVDDLQRIRDGDLPRLRARNREVPIELELVIRKAMDRDRERRYADMEAFGADLQAVLQRRPIKARRLGLGLRLVRWCQRHRVTATALAAILLAATTVPAVFAVRERAVNEELGIARQLAEQSLDETLTALNSVLVRLGGAKLRHVPMAEVVAIESLQDAANMYRRLLPKHPDHARLRQQGARCLDSLAAALRRGGRLAESVAVSREAFALLGGDSVDEPDGIVDGRAHVAMNLAGLMVNEGDWTGGAEFLAKAERDFAAVADDPAYRISAIRGRGELASMRSLLPPAATDPLQKVACLEESVRLAREWCALAPDDPEARVTEIRRIDNLATLFVQQKREDEAQTMLQDALAKARAVPVDARVLPSPKQVLAAVLETLGTLEMNRRDIHAEESLGECLQLREELAREFPANHDLRCELGAAAHNLGLLYYRTQRDELALAQFERARDLQRSVLAESPTRQLALDYLQQTLQMNGTCLIQVARREALVRNAAELGGLKQRPTALRTAARHYLRAIELLARETVADAERLRGDYAEQAMALLLEAEAAGWGSGSRFDEAVYAPLQQDPRFAALKERIAARLAAKGDAAAKPPAQDR